MKKEDLGALKNLYQGIFTEGSESVVSDKPTTARTINNGLGIYENQIKSSEVSVPQKQIVLSEDAEVVTQITSSTPSTTPLKSASGILGNAQWGSVSTVNDISELYSSIYEKKEDHDEDGDNDFDDVRIARMIASGMSKEEAMRKVKEDPKGDEVKKEEVEQVDEGTPAQRARDAVTNQRGGYHGDADYFKKNMDAIDSNLKKMRPYGAAGFPHAKAKPKATTQMAGYEPEVEMVDEAAKRAPKKVRGAKDPVEYMKGRSDAGKRISGDEKSGPVKYSVRASSVDAPTQPGEKPKNTPKLSKREKEYAKYQHADTMSGIKKGYLRFGGPKGLPENSNYLNNTDTDNNTGSISEMTQNELIYNIVASYLLENNFAEDIDGANSMMEAMSSAWVGTIIEEYNEYVEDYNEFVENLEIAGYDLSEATEEDIEEAYKNVDKKKAVERAANKEKASKKIRQYSVARVKGIEQSNKMRGALTGGRKADRPAVKGDKSKDEPGGYDPEKLNKDWYSRATPGSKMRRKGGEMETVSQRMDREHPYKNRMTGKMGREYGSRAAANVTDVLKALEGNRKKRS
jgi:hypothetical protein